MRILAGLAITTVALAVQATPCLAQSAPPGARPAPGRASNPESDLDLPVEGTITNPDWVQLPTGDQMAHFYPPLANALGINGVVRMTCEVTTLGMVENCRIASETPTGIGFGDAALQMASSFRMRPQMVNGAPVSGALVTIPINFTMFGDQSAAAPESAAAAPPASVAQLAMARRLASAMFSPEASKARADQMVAQIQQVAERTPGADPDQSAKAMSAWRSAYEAAMPKWRELMAQAYARTYSQVELTQIAAFLESPAGQAWQSRSAEVEQNVARANQSWLLGIQQDAHKLFCEQTACPGEKPTMAGPAK